MREVKTVDELQARPEWVQKLLDVLAAYPLAMSIVIFVLSVMAAKLTAIIFSKVLARAVKQTRVNWDDQLLVVLRPPVFWTVLLVGVIFAITPLKLSASVVDVLHAVIYTVMIVIWTGLCLKATRIILQAMSDSAKVQSLVRPQTRPLFENISFIVILILAVYFIFLAWSIDMTAWLASAGIVGIAVGFAARDTLANLFSGVFILADAPYKIGDYVVLDSGDRGKVTHIGIRSTRLLTRDDVEITIPNAIMGNTRIINESGGPYEKFRVRVAVGVAYGSDIDQVKSILMDVAVNEPQVCGDPEPRVRFRRFGASSLDIELLCWAENPELRGRLLDALNTTIYKRFRDEGVEIPYSKQDVYIKELPKP